MKKAIVSMVIVVALTACSADISVAEKEIEVIQITKGGKTYGNAVALANQLTSAYLAEARSMARGRDATFLSLLAIGSFAGYRGVDGASSTELARTALFGAAAGQAASYYAPGVKAQKLVRAANRTVCVANVGASHQVDIIGTRYSAPAAALMVSTVDKVRSILRSELTNQPVDYSTIANAIEQATKQNEDTKEPSAADKAAADAGRAGMANFRAREIVAKKAFAEMKVALEKCPAA